MFLNLLPAVGFILFGASRVVARLRRNSTRWCFRSADSFNRRLKSEFERAESPVSKPTAGAGAAAATNLARRTASPPPAPPAAATESQTANVVAGADSGGQS